MPKCEPAEIVAAVERHATETSPLRDRMDGDYSLYRLDEYTGEEDDEQGYRHFTSNEPMTYADKVMSWLNDANLTARIPTNGRDSDTREADTNKEQFVIGMLRAADERLMRRALLPIKESFAFQAALRGWVAVRHLIVKREDGSSYVDIMPWDPRNTYWSMGADGLEWICYRMRKSRSQIMSEYGVDIPQAGDTERRGIDVYDYYDGETNSVCTADLILVDSVPHAGEQLSEDLGYPFVPATVIPVPTTPMVQTETIDDTIEDYGESVFKADRRLYKHVNMIMSVLTELVSRARKPPSTYTSRDGSKALEEDPFQTGTEIPLAEGERFEVLDLLRASPDTAPYIAMITGMVQRGALPYSVYGEIQFALSGYAITTLKQGIDSVLRSRLKAMEHAYLQVAQSLCSQYATGSFEAMTLSGRDRMRNYFSMEFKPDDIKKAGDLEINLVGNLPQDDAAKMAAAQMMREGKVPLMPDRWIRDDFLGLQDVDQIDRLLKEQVGERGHPLAGTVEIMKALAEQGRPDLAQIYYVQAIGMVKELFGQVMGGPPGGQPGGPGGMPGGPPGGMPGPPGGPPGPPGGMPMPGMPMQGMPMPGGPAPMPGGPPGLSPTVLPNQALGFPPPRPTPQAGPMVPPGQPRPGALTPEERLRRIGLAGPRG